MLAIIVNKVVHHAAQRIAYVTLLGTCPVGIVEEGASVAVLFLNNITDVIPNSRSDATVRLTFPTVVLLYNSAAFILDC